MYWENPQIQDKSNFQTASILVEVKENIHNSPHQQRARSLLKADLVEPVIGHFGNLDWVSGLGVVEHRRSRVSDDRRSWVLGPEVLEVGCLAQLLLAIDPLRLRRSYGCEVPVENPTGKRRHRRRRMHGRCRRRCRLQCRQRGRIWLAIQPMHSEIGD